MEQVENAGARCYIRIGRRSLPCLDEEDDMQLDPLAIVIPGRRSKTKPLVPGPAGAAGKTIPLVV
jgi:hypothetical protein